RYAPSGVRRSAASSIAAGSPAGPGTSSSEHVDDREARVGVEARGCEERGADVPGEKGVAAAAAVRFREPIGLGERVDGKAASPLEPAFVIRARERLQEREAVPRGAVA